MDGLIWLLLRMYITPHSRGCVSASLKLEIGNEARVKPNTSYESTIKGPSNIA